MEVRPGYKRTEVGIIPENWEVKPLKRISPKQSVGLVINPSTYFENSGTVPMLVGSHVSENHIEWESANRISDSSNSLLSASRLVANDLVTVRVGEPGITAVIPPELDGCNCASMMIVRQHQSFDSNWLCSVMNSPIGLTQIRNVQYGTAQKQFNISDAINFLYPVPPLPEQHIIAAALSDVDSLLSALKALLAKKRLIKQGAIQELLAGKRRLSGFSGEWEVKKFGELGKSLRGVSYKGESDLSPIDTDKTTRLLRSNNVQNANVVFEDLQFVNSQRVSEHQIMRENDILICMANGSKDLVGKAAVFHAKDHHKYTFGTFMGCFRLNSDEASSSFVAQTFQTNQYRNYIANLIAGSSINNLKPSDIESIEIPFPSKPEQTAIAAILSDMDAEIAALEVQREKTRLLKQGMMQELLTGRIRLL